MANNSLAHLQEAMDRLWFQQNILLSESILLSLNNTMKTTRKPPLEFYTTTLSSGDKPAADNRNRQSPHKTKPTRLHLVTSTHDFQMPPLLPPPPRSEIQCSSSSTSQNTTPHTRNSSRRRRLGKMIRSYKSLSELEHDELKGFKDLGFEFHKDVLNPRMMSVLPGLQRLADKEMGDEWWKRKGDMEEKEERVRRPYLSEAWLINRPDSQLLNLRMLPVSAEGADMKRHLQFWARTVASKIKQEP